MQPRPAARSGGVPSIISNDLRIVGDLHSSGDLQIDGAVEGDITSRSLTIGESAVVKGALAADTVRIYGAVEGQVKADTVALAKTARVNGDILHQTLSMESGAELTGSLSRMQAAPRGAAAASDGAEPGEKGTLAAARADVKTTST